MVSPTAATFYFYKSFWSVLRSQALETLLNLLNLTWPCSKDQDLLRDLLCNLLRNPVEPDLALHQSFPDLLDPEPSPEPCCTWPGSAPKPPGTFSGTFSGTFFGTRWTWLGFAPRLPGTFSGAFFGTQPDLALHQSLPEPSLEPSPEPCWTWPGSAPKPPRPSPELSSEPSLTWLCTKASRNLLRSLLRNPLEPDLALHRSLPDLLRNLLRNPKPPGTFSGTFFGTLLNLTWLCTKASQTFSWTFGTFSGTSLNLTRRLHQCTPELSWAEDPSSLRCWWKMSRQPAAKFYVYSDVSHTHTDIYIYTYIHTCC